VYGDGRRLRCDNRDLWQSDVDATARKDYIQTTLKANQTLGIEYDTVHGSVLRRVTGQVEPSRAKAYATAFTLVTYQPGPELQPGA
jgi:hypothetical protein